MIEELKYVILGAIQGVAEFFPISSSGHTTLFSSIFKVADNQPLLFVITLHFATTLSTMIVYRNRIKEIVLGALIKKNNFTLSFLLKLMTSAIPIAIVGFTCKSNIDELFANGNQIVSYMLLVTAIILLISKYAKSSDSEVTYKSAILMGLAQTIAIIPGISRSGATITTALFCGTNRKKAAEFSFLMVLVPIIGMTCIEILELNSSRNIHLSPMELKGLILAFISAVISGWIACKYMIILVEKNHLNYFGYYCLIIGIISLLFI